MLVPQSKVDYRCFLHDDRLQNQDKSNQNWIFQFHHAKHTYNQLWFVKLALFQLRRVGPYIYMRDAPMRDISHLKWEIGWGGLTFIYNANNLNVRAPNPISHIRWEISLIGASPPTIITFYLLLSILSLSSSLNPILLFLLPSFYNIIFVIC